MIKCLAIKAMQRAFYFNIADKPIQESWNHYALNMSHYTHFTSPIRRYADVIVHRLLYAALDMQGQRAFVPPEERSRSFTKKPKDVVSSNYTISSIAKQCNLKKENARNAQDTGIRIFLCAYLFTKFKGEVVIDNAVIIRVMDRSVDVLVEQYGIERKLWIEDIQSQDLAKSTFSESKGRAHWKIWWWNKKKKTETEEASSSSLHSGAPSPTHSKGCASTNALYQNVFVHQSE